MTQPTTRALFKNLCLSRLGDPLVKVNVSDAQVEQRIDYALAKARDFHFDFSQRTYVMHEITDDDKTNGYATVPANILEVINILDLSSFLMGGGIFNLKYQFVLSNFQSLFRAIDLTNYVVVMQNLQLLEQILVGKTPIRWNRYVQDVDGFGKLYLDTDWEQFGTGTFLAIECYIVLDPNTHVKMWSDAWLQEYATAQIKQQWGNNLKKFGKIQMPGGVVFNGQEIYNEAQDEIVRLEKSLILDYSIPVADMIG